MSERDRMARSDEGAPDVEGHAKFYGKLKVNEDEDDRRLSPEDRAGESREEKDEPDVEAHRMNQRA